MTRRGRSKDARVLEIRSRVVQVPDNLDQRNVQRRIAYKVCTIEEDSFGIVERVGKGIEVGRWINSEITGRWWHWAVE